MFSIPHTPRLASSSSIRAALATAAAVSLVMGLSACATTSSSGDEMGLLDAIRPEINENSSLPDGSYILQPGTRGNKPNECLYGGVAETLAGVSVGNVEVYGTGPGECDYEQVERVYFKVVGGVQVIEKVIGGPID